MAKLLIDESPLVFSPNLARIIGLSESIVLQQIHYWLETNKEANRNFHDDYYWTFNSYSEWQKQFPFWNVSTVKRIFAKLEKEGYIITGNYNKLNIDRTKWYRINYEALQTLIIPPLSQNEPTIVSNCTNHSIILTPPIPETNSETSPQTNTEGNSKSSANKGIFKENSMSFLDFTKKNPEAIFSDDIIPAVEYYLATYMEYTGKEHPNLKESQWQNVVTEILHVEGDYLDDYIELDDIIKMIDKHFITQYNNCDWNINHFVSGDIMKNRFYEECY